MKPKSISSIKRHRAAKMAKIAARALYLQKKGDNVAMANYICDELVSLGGIYIKFLQGVMLQSEFFKQWSSPSKLNIFENLDSELINIGEFLRAELSPSKLANISQVQPQPFAAGSFGQVYYGTLDDGTPIIIKVLRPLVRETLQFDLRLIGIFSKQFFKKLYENVQINPDTAIKEFKRASLNETDYIAEANFANELHLAYKDNQKLLIPKTYLDLCTKNIIVQEYIGGISAAQLIKQKEQGVDPYSNVKEVLGSDLDLQLIELGIQYFYGMFTLPRIQGDPHPGNVKLLANNQIGLIDFGIEAPAPKDKPAFFGLIKEYSNIYVGKLDIEELFGRFLKVFANDLYNAFRKINQVRDGGEDGDLTKTIGRIANKTFMSKMKTGESASMTNDPNIIKLINRVVNDQNRFGIELSLESTEMLRAAQTYINLVESLGRKDKVLPVVFSKAIAKLELEHPELVVEKMSNMSVARAINIITKWLERVATRDPVLFRKLISHVRGNSNLSDLNKFEKEKS
ncbi:MAG TPA: AarF/ABC1/UbiB kinase family protein [Candidatus Saccharimonadales bacterium]